MVEWNRRELLRRGLALAGLGLLAGCGAGSSPQQPARVRRIGVLSYTTVPGTIPGAFLSALEDGLGTLGYGFKEGDVQVRSAQRPDQYDGFAAELLRLGVDVFVVDTVSAALAARKAAPTLPIVFVNIGDPVGAGLVASLARPAGSITGLSSVSPQLSGKRLQLLKECFPRLSRVAVLRNPDDPGTALEYAATQAAAGALGLDLQGLEVRGDADVSAVLAAVTAGHADGLIAFNDPLVFSNRHRILGFALNQRLPTVFNHRAFVEQAGLMSYGPNLEDLWRKAATYVDKILKGAKPADLPVEQPSRFDLIVNRRVVEALGLTLPQSVVVQVTELIQ
jgi:putative tryptophan/tyrosine transport system substrate-binding protein